MKQLAWIWGHFSSGSSQHSAPAACVSVLPRVDVQGWDHSGSSRGSLNFTTVDSPRGQSEKGCGAMRVPDAGILRRPKNVSSLRGNRTPVI